MIAHDPADLSHVFVPTKRVQAAIELLDEALTWWRSGGSDPLTAIFAPPRAGKTSIAKTWAARKLGLAQYPAPDDGPGVPRIAYIELGPKCSMASFLGDWLYALKDPAPDRGTWIQKETRVFKLIEKFGIEAVIIDEGQNILDANTGSIPREVGRWLTLFLNAKVCAILMFGEKRLKRLFEPFIPGKTQGNDQLEGRNVGVLYLAPYDWEVKCDRLDYRAMLHAMEPHLTRPVESGLSSIGMAWRVLHFSRGLIGQSARLSKKADLVAIKKKHAAITMEDFADAVDALRIGTARKRINPFRVDVIPQNDNSAPEWED